MKKQISTINEIYGGYASVNFVENLLNTSKEAKVRIRHHLNDVIKKDDNEAIKKVVEAEEFWKLFERECHNWLMEYAEWYYQAKNYLAKY